MGNQCCPKTDSKPKRSSIQPVPDNEFNYATKNYGNLDKNLDPNICEDNNDISQMSQKGPGGNVLGIDDLATQRIPRGSNFTVNPSLNTDSNRQNKTVLSKELNEKKKLKQLHRAVFTMIGRIMLGEYEIKTSKNIDQTLDQAPPIKRYSNENQFLNGEKENNQPTFIFCKNSTKDIEDDNDCDCDDCQTVSLDYGYVDEYGKFYYPEDYKNGKCVHSEIQTQYNSSKLNKKYENKFDLDKTDINVCPNTKCSDIPYTEGYGPKSQRFTSINVPMKFNDPISLNPNRKGDGKNIGDFKDIDEEEGDHGKGSGEKERRVEEGFGKRQVGELNQEKIIANVTDTDSLSITYNPPNVLVDEDQLNKSEGINEKMNVDRSIYYTQKIEESNQQDIYDAKEEVDKDLEEAFEEVKDEQEEEFEEKLDDQEEPFEEVNDDQEGQFEEIEGDYQQENCDIEYKDENMVYMDNKNFSEMDIDKDNILNNIINIPDSSNFVYINNDKSSGNTNVRSDNDSCSKASI